MIFGIYRSKTCPECREKVSDKKIRRIYLNFTTVEIAADDTIAELKSKNCTLNHQFLVKELELATVNVQNSKLSDTLKTKEIDFTVLEIEMWNVQTEFGSLKCRVAQQDIETKKEIARLTAERDLLR